MYDVRFGNCVSGSFHVFVRGVVLNCKSTEPSPSYLAAPHNYPCVCGPIMPSCIAIVIVYGS